MSGVWTGTQHWFQAVSCIRVKAEPGHEFVQELAVPRTLVSPAWAAFPRSGEGS